MELFSLMLHTVNERHGVEIRYRSYSQTGHRPYRISDKLNIAPFSGCVPCALIRLSALRYKCKQLIRKMRRGGRLKFVSGDNFL